MNQHEQASIEMPKYQCHKQVWALKIKDVHRYHPSGANGEALITPEDTGYAPFLVSASYDLKHRPEAGGYYVVYDDGYKSFSPAAAFESGYTRL